MREHWKVCSLIGVAVLLLCWRLGPGLMGGIENLRGPDNQEVTYICLETKEVVTGPAQAVPAINPKTGRATLARAVYHPPTRTWVAAPPDEVLRRQRREMALKTGALQFASPEASEQKAP